MPVNPVYCTLCNITIWVICPLPRSRSRQKPVPNFTGHYASNQEQEASGGGKQSRLPQLKILYIKTPFLKTGQNKNSVPITNIEELNKNI